MRTKMLASSTQMTVKKTLSQRKRESILWLLPSRGFYRAWLHKATSMDKISSRAEVSPNAHDTIFAVRTAFTGWDLRQHLDMLTGDSVPYQTTSNPLDKQHTL